MRYALVRDGTVVEEREYQSLDGVRVKAVAGKAMVRPIREVRPPLDPTVERYGPPTTEIKDTEVVRTYPVARIPLGELIDGKQDEITAYRDGLAEAGFTWNGATFDMDDRSAQAIVATFALALAAQGNPALWPAGFEWVAKDNSRVPMTPAQAMAFAKAAFDARRKAIMNGRTHKDAVAKLADPKAIVGYDFSGEW